MILIRVLRFIKIFFKNSMLKKFLVGGIMTYMIVVRLMTHVISFNSLTNLNLIIYLF